MINGWYIPLPYRVLEFSMQASYCVGPPRPNFEGFLTCAHVDVMTICILENAYVL
jgi:hypothetical protein